jgi:hypothetical protein
MKRVPASPAQAGDLMLDPMILLALSTLVVNDHVLKGVGPAPLTGILSGIAGLVLMPVVLVAGAELILSARGRWLAPAMGPMLASCLAVGCAYALVELVPAATELYRWTWGIIQWPVSAVIELAGSRSLSDVVPVRAVADPLDLLALPVLAIPVMIQARRASVASRTFTPA